MKKYSIVVPIYNAASYLPECLENILAQTYVHWELILVNDGSTDESLKICKEAQAKFPEKIKIIDQENKGLLQARRIGLAHTTGDYLLAVDADDLLARTALEEIDKALTQTAADFLFFNISMQKDFSRSAMKIPYENLEVFTAENKAELYDLMGHSVDFNPIWNKVIAREIMDFETDYSIYGKKVQMGEDLLQVLPLITKAQRIVYLAKNLYFYRITTDSMTKQALQIDRYESNKLVLEKFYEHIDSWNLKDGEQLKSQKTAEYLKQRLSDLTRSDLQKDYVKVVDYLMQISADEFFHNFYKSMKLAKLTVQDKLIFSLLYHRKIKTLIFLYRLNQKRL